MGFCIYIIFLKHFIRIQIYDKFKNEKIPTATAMGN